MGPPISPEPRCEYNIYKKVKEKSYVDALINPSFWIFGQLLCTGKWIFRPDKIWEFLYIG